MTTYRRGFVRIGLGRSTDHVPGGKHHGRRGRDCQVLLKGRRTGSCEIQYSKVDGRKVGLESGRKYRTWTTSARGAIPFQSEIGDHSLEERG